MSDPIRIAQLSDTHFLAEDESPEGGFAYNTSDAFQAVLAHLSAHDPFDLVTVTGDIADHGRRDQYEQAVNAFSQIQAPINTCPGNHDQDVVFTASMGRPGIGTSRVIEIGAWCFVFADSNSGVQVPDATGRYVDPDAYEDRLHGNGSLGEREAGWIHQVCAATTAEHIFIWLHHPPSTPMPMCKDQAYTAEWTAIIDDLPKVRGFGAGHTHTPGEHEFAGRPVFTCPALKHNFDMQARTMLAPGYRTYEFSADGTVTSQAQLCDDPRWPRRPLGRAVMSLLNAELSDAEFSEIVARHAASRSSGE